MNRTRTQVGIVEWGRRARAMELVHRAVADALGGTLARDRTLGLDSDAAAQRALLDRARRHAFCAEQWGTVVPVLHDVDLDTVQPDRELVQVSAKVPFAIGARATLAAEATLTDFVARRGEEWTVEAADLADAPYRHVLGRVATELAGVDPR